VRARGVEQRGALHHLRRAVRGQQPHEDRGGRSAHVAGAGEPPERVLGAGELGPGALRLGRCGRCLRPRGVGGRPCRGDLRLRPRRLRGRGLGRRLRGPHLLEQPADLDGGGVGGLRDRAQLVVGGGGGRRARSAGQGDADGQADRADPARPAPLEDSGPGHLRTTCRIGRSGLEQCIGVPPWRLEDRAGPPPAPG
jgi:hypothetical protein